MKAYVGQARGAQLIAKLDEQGIGEMTQPCEWPPRRSRSWVLDNHAFHIWRKGKTFKGRLFGDALAQCEYYDMRPDFAVCPDVVGDHAATRAMAMARAWRPVIGPRIRAYFVAQDGLTDDDARAVLADFDGLFIGGTPEWKDATSPHWVALAHDLGKPCHIGRVGSARRVRWAQSIGADSIDSCTPLFSEANLSAWLWALKSSGFQSDLFAPPPAAPARKPIPKRKPKAVPGALNV